MGKLSFPNKAIFICTGSKCGKHKEIKKYIKQYNKENEDSEKVEIFKMECSDRCKNAPIAYYQPKNVWLEKADTTLCKTILEKD
jgi:NADH:ubiquinone oxidoreductase subunit E